MGRNHSLSFYMMAISLVSLIFFSACSSDIEDPIFTTGKIYDGSQNTFQYDNGAESKGKTQIKYVYQSKSGKTHKTTQEINKEAFSQVFKGQYIQIVYSEKEPHLSVPLVDVATVEKYVDQKNRHLELDDLYQFMKIKGAKDLEQALNKISYKWSYQKEDSTEMWYNMAFSESIFKNDEDMIGYMTRSNKMFNRMRNKMKKDGFEEMLKLGSGHSIWNNDKYLAELSLSIETEGRGKQATSIHYYSIAFIERSESDLVPNLELDSSE